MEGYISANLARKVTGFSEEDLDLLWEAIINMFEHRGHFLLNSVSEDINKEMVKDAGEGFTLYLQERIKEIKPVSYSDILDVLVEKNISRSEKKERIVELFAIKKSSYTVCIYSRKFLISIISIKPVDIVIILSVDFISLSYNFSSKILHLLQFFLQICTCRLL